MKKTGPKRGLFAQELAASVVVAATEAGDKENPDQPFAVVVIVTTATASVVAANQATAATAVTTAAAE